MLEKQVFRLGHSQFGLAAPPHGMDVITTWQCTTSTEPLLFASWKGLLQRVSNCAVSGTFVLQETIVTYIHSINHSMTFKIILKQDAKV